jgi:hypothetical protein
MVEDGALSRIADTKGGSYLGELEQSSKMQGNLRLGGVLAENASLAARWPIDGDRDG